MLAGSDMGSKKVALLLTTNLTAEQLADLDEFAYVLANAQWGQQIPSKLQNVYDLNRLGKYLLEILR